VGDREPFPGRALPAAAGFRRPGEDRPDRRRPRFAFREEPVGVGERPQQRAHVGHPRSEIVENDDRGPRLPSKTPEESRDDLGGGESLPSKSFVQPLKQLGRHGVGPARPPDPHGDDERRPRPPFATARFIEATGGEARQRRCPGSGGSEDRRPPWARIRGQRVAEPLHQAFQFAPAADRNWRDPIGGEHFGVLRIQHG
jgi:hypothetical protein